MKIDFNNIKIKKKLGSGLFGTTYLCEYKNKIYALKRFKILEQDKIINDTNKIWKEIDLYNYINTLPKNLQIFFTKLYGYNITDTISHIQIRTDNYIIDTKLEEMDKSKWVMEHLMDYKGSMMLGEFIYNKKIISKKLVMSFIFQIINIICILNNGGYSHSDLHSGNIMINKTTRKSFNLTYEKSQFRIPYEGYQLSAIDYGSVKSKKYNNEKDINFKKYNELWHFHEITTRILSLITGEQYIFSFCTQKKNAPWFTIKNWDENILKQIFDNNNDFYNSAMKKYLKIFPKGKQLIEILNSSLKEGKILTYKDIKSNTKNYSIQIRFELIISRIKFEFLLNYPKLYIKYMNCSNIGIKEKPLLDKNKLLEILLINNNNTFINYLLREAKKV